MPRILKSSERELLLRVKEFCEREKRNKGLLIPIECVRRRVAAMAGVSPNTVSNIVKQGEIAASTSTKIPTPGQKRFRDKEIKLDDFEVCFLRHKIYEYYTVRKELPTLAKLLNEMQSEINFKGGRTSLWKILKGMGFNFNKKCKSKRSVLMERYDIVSGRYRYLKEMRDNRNEFYQDRRPVVYLDQTYIYPTQPNGKCEQIKKEELKKEKKQKAPRWVVVHAGGEMGFIPNAQLIFESQSKTGENRDDMNSENFMKWIKEKLLPNLPPQSLVVMDNNASYHTVPVNKTPTMSSTKAEMQNWIKSRGLAYLPTMVKAQLFEIIKLHKEPPVYEVDLLLEEHGHKAVRLPLLHGDLNPLKLVWTQLRSWIADKSVGQDTKNIVSIIEEAFSSVTAENWKMLCNHVKTIEVKYYNNDMAVDQEIDKFIIF